VFPLPNSAKRVVIRVQGGLGNQMFQIALGIALKKSYDIDVDYIRLNEPILKRGNSTRRRLDIRSFLATQNLRIHEFNPLLNSVDFVDALKTLYDYKIYKVFKEGDSLGDLIPNSQAEVIGLDGYWQSETFFEGAKGEVCKSFESLTRKSSNFRFLENMFADESFIGIHVRRSDYITNTKAKQFHGVCSIKYFESALSFLLQKNRFSKVAIFSDDPEWATVNLGGDNRIIVSDQYKLTAPEELHLLSKCSHLILSNSSFSWWAAYLAESRNHRTSVVAPYPWFQSIKQTRHYQRNWLRYDIESGLPITPK
jgi:hypothetical protein